MQPPTCAVRVWFGGREVRERVCGGGEDGTTGRSAGPPIKKKRRPCRTARAHTMPPPHTNIHTTAPRVPGRVPPRARPGRPRPTAPPRARDARARAPAPRRPARRQRARLWPGAARWRARPRPRRPGRPWARARRRAAAARRARGGAAPHVPCAAGARAAVSALWLWVWREEGSKTSGRSTNQLAPSPLTDRRARRHHRARRRRRPRPPPMMAPRA